METPDAENSSASKRRLRRRVPRVQPRRLRRLRRLRRGDDGGAVLRRASPQLREYLVDVDGELKEYRGEAAHGPA